MAVTTAHALDLSQVLAEILEPIAGLRLYWYVADTVRPATNGGALVVMQPTVDYLDQASAFCSATWTYPLTLLVARNNDRDAQLMLSRLLQEVTAALGTAVPPNGILSIDPVDARPTVVNLSGTDLPGYAITVRIRA